MQRRRLELLALGLLTLSYFNQAMAEPAASPEQENKQVSAETRLQNAKHPSMTLHTGPDALKKTEYIIIDSKGGITRSLCPYSCEDRGLAKEHCKTWPSIQDPSNCYVQDTRIESQVFNSGK